MSPASPATGSRYDEHLRMHTHDTHAGAEERTGVRSASVGKYGSWEEEDLSS